MATHLVAPRASIPIHLDHFFRQLISIGIRRQSGISRCPRRGPQRQRPSTCTFQASHRSLIAIGIWLQGGLCTEHEHVHRLTHFPLHPRPPRMWALGLWGKGEHITSHAFHLLKGVGGFILLDVSSVRMQLLMILLVVAVDASIADCIVSACGSTLG